jgi:flagellar biosynthesis protein FlhF
LRIYAKILGVPVHTVSSSDDLAQAIDSLRAKHQVLIDTVGMGQRDTRLAEHAMVLAQPDVKRLLLLNASSQAETLDEVVTAYGVCDAGAGDGHGGCIITKQDESARPGQVLDVIIRRRLRVHYVSNGQRVPEDIQTANASYLAHRSFKPFPRGFAFHLRSDEIPSMSVSAGAAHA